MSVIVWLLSALLMLIGSCSQPVGQASTSVQRDLCDVDSAWVAYTVTSSDTLSSIAGRTGSTAEALAAGNCLDDLNLIQNGQTLYVPRTPDPLPTNNGGVQPTVAGYLTPLQGYLTPLSLLTIISQSITTVWVDVPADLPVDTRIELVLVMPDGSQQVVSSTNTVMLNRNSEAWLTWVTPATPVANAQIFARGGGYISPIVTVRIADVQVRAFTADKTSLQPNESVTLSWSVSGGTSVSIYRSAGGIIASGEPLEGSITVTGPGEGAEINSVLYTLLIAAEDGTVYDLLPPAQIEIPLVKP
ncbi:MAG: LysM peptidoglycan-binding domain-containing protein [Anaerolineae bacterium]|jgi:LysM repeat protein|nr:LysM peptidoglycan-binding domain-containing protein [Anaerolineae bacterium]